MARRVTAKATVVVTRLAMVFYVNGKQFVSYRTMSSMLKKNADMHGVRLPGQRDRMLDMVMLALTEWEVFVVAFVSCLPALRAYVRELKTVKPIAGDESLQPRQWGEYGTHNAEELSYRSSTSSCGDSVHAV